MVVYNNHEVKESQATGELMHQRQETKETKDKMGPNDTIAIVGCIVTIIKTVTYVARLCHLVWKKRSGRQPAMDSSVENGNCETERRQHLLTVVEHKV